MSTPIYATGFADDSADTATAAGAVPEPSAASSAFDEMLEKFALPLEFKSTKDSVKDDAAADKVDEKVDGATSSKGSDEKGKASETTTSAERSIESTAETKTQKVEDKKEQADSKVVQKVEVTDSDAKVVQKVDDKKELAAKEEIKVEQKVDKKEQAAKEVVQKVDDRKEQTAKEETKVQKVDEEKKEVASKQEEATPAPTSFGPIVTPRRMFSDFGAPQRPEPKIKFDFGEETRMKPTALGVNPNRKTEVVKMEEPEPTAKQQPSPTPTKEVETPTESKTEQKTSDVPAKDASKSAAADEKSSIMKSAPSSTEIAPSSTSSDLIKTQPITSPSINLPESLRNVNVEDPGIIAGGTVVLGIALYLALVQSTNKVDKSTETGEEVEKEPNLIQKVKDAGVAGAISYAIWELGFWGISIPICVVAYNKFTGHWPDLSNSDDMKQLGGEIFAFANVARLAVPLRIGLALSTAPWIDENVVQKFRKDDDDAQQKLETEEVALKEQTFVEEGKFVREDENQYGEVDMSNEDEGYLEWSGDDWQEGEMGYGYEGNGEEWQYGDEGYGDEASQWSSFEERLSNIEANAMLVASVLVSSQSDGPSQSDDANSVKTASLPGTGYLNYIDEYCEPGTRSSNCAGALKGYLDGLATTGAVASDREVTTIVGYLDSLSSNTTPGSTSRTGAAFATYLDALSSGMAPSPPSAEAVAGYLDDLTEGSVGTRVVDIEGRLNQLESSISSLPDDIASRIIDWQDSQDKKMSEELEKIKKMLEDVKS